MAVHGTRRVRANLFAAVLVAMTAAVAACGGGGDGGGASVTTPSVQVGSVVVTLPATQLQVGAQLNATAEVRSTAGAVLGGRTVVWSSGNTSIASVSDAGIVSGVAPGTVTITATSEGRTGVAALSVVPAPVNVVAVSAPASTLVADRTLQLTVALRDERGATLAGRTVAWSSSAPQVATVNDAGVVTGISVGTATITASSEGKTGTLVLTVVPPPVNSVTLSLAQSTIPQGSTTTASVSLRDDRNVALTGRAVTFTSSDPAVASVSDAGVVTALAMGTTTITATSEGKNGSVALTVIQAPVATVNVALSSSSLLPGAVAQAQVVLRDAAGRTLTGRSISFASSNPSVAGVNSEGVVTAIAPGTVLISATSEGQTGQATLQVLVPVASVVINGSTRVKVGDTYTYTATARAADGTVLDRAVTWRVREAARAQMSPDGTLVPLQSGGLTIVAQINGTEWDASYTAYDWVSLSGSGSTFEYLDADIRISNRLGTLDYPQLVLSCGSTGDFFLWISTPHIITQNGIVAFSFDGGPATAQTWRELSPDYTTLWKTGGNTTVKSFAAQIAAARRFGFAFGEFLSNLTKTTQFRVTGLAPRLMNLFTLCPAAAPAPGVTTMAEPSLAERAEVMRVFASKRAVPALAGTQGPVAGDAQRRAEQGPTKESSRVLGSWPTWSVTEMTTARRVKR